MIKQPFRFPKKILDNVRGYLEFKKRKTEKDLEKVKEEDPFSNTDRINDNASSDTDVKEQYGHARAAAITRELERALIRIKKTLARIGLGKYGFCEKCGQMIDTERLSIMPTADLCIKCARGKKVEKK